MLQNTVLPYTIICYSVTDSLCEPVAPNMLPAIFVHMWDSLQAMYVHFDLFIQ
jgi:hypothetical protein